MKGPVVFASSLVAVSLLAALFVLPARREIVDLVRLEEGFRRTDRAVVEASRRLSRALGLPRSGDPAAVRSAAAAKEFARDAPADTSATLRFPLDWSRLPELLEWLAVEPGAAPEAILVTTSANPSRCRVELRFAATAPGVTPR